MPGHIDILSAFLPLFCSLLLVPKFLLLFLLLYLLIPFSFFSSLSFYSFLLRPSYLKDGTDYKCHLVAQ